MILSLEMRCSIRCNDCSVRNPLPGLRESTYCVNCSALCDNIKVHKDNAQGGVTYDFGGYYDSVVDGLIQEEGAVLAEGDGYICPTRLVRKEAVCSCGTKLPIPEADAKNVTCTSCKDQVVVRWPDDTTRKWDARIWCIVGDSGEHADHAPPKKKEGEVIPCSQCGAALTPEGNRRTATCAYCHATSFLSDAQRTQLFPQSLDHPFFLLYQLTDEKVLGMVNGLKDLDHAGRKGRARVREQVAKLQKEASDRVLDASGPIDHKSALAIAKRDDLTNEQVQRFDSRLSDDDRKALLGGKVNPRICISWATSTDADIRGYAATHLEASELVDTLAKDTVSHVREKVARRRSITAAQIELLARDVDASVRAALAASPHVDPTTLKTLSKDHDANVAAAAKKNPKYVPGFFEKLFS